MKPNGSEGKSSNGSVYHLLQNPAPICMFYFAHPFGIASPASGAKLAQIRERATKGVDEPTPNGPTTVDSNHHPQTNATDGPKTHKQRKSKAGTRKEPHPPKAHRKVNGFPTEKARVDSKPTTEDAEQRQKKSKKHRTHQRRISNFEKFLLEMQHCHRCVPPDGSFKIRRIDREDRITPLVPWPSIIWNREFLIPTLLQALAQQHGRKIPDIEQILRTVRSAWNTPKSQRSHLQSQESRESSASNWDLSSLCDSYCCYLEHRRGKMGAGTYANAASPGPGLLRRRYSVPEIIMRKHTLAQQKTDDEPPWLQHDTNHNVIEVVGSKGAGSPGHRARIGGTAPGTPLHRKSFGLRQPDERPVNGRSSSVESGPAGGGRTRRTVAATLTATGSDPNLASLKHRVGGVAFGVCSSPLCNGLGGGIGASRAVATGTGGSLRSIHNNSLSCSSSSSLSGPPAVAGGSSGSGGSGGSGGSHGGKCGHHHHQHQPHPILVGGSNGPSPVFVREGDYSMRKTTLLRRMWSRELRRYERSGSWSPPLRRAPRRIYSIESIASVEGHQQQQQQQQEDEVGRPGSSGSSVGSGRCATTATTTTTTTTGTTSCLECAKLESQYTGGFGTGKSLLARTVGPVELSSREPPGTLVPTGGSGEHESRVPKSEHPSRGIDPTVDDRRQKGRRQQRMCSSQTADLGVESVSARIIVDGPLEPPADLVVQGENEEEDDDDDEEEEEEEDEQDLDPEGEYLSHSSSVSSIASQSYRASGAPARVNDHDLSDLSEFLQQEQLAARADVPGAEPPSAAKGGSTKVVNGVENDCEAAGQAAPVGVGNPVAGDHSRERAPVAGGPAAAAAAAAEARGRDEQYESTQPGPESEAVKQFPLRSAKRQRARRPSDDSSVALSALPEDSDSTSASDFEDGTTGGDGDERHETNARVDEKDQARLDEYISNLLLDNLNNLADAKELVLATSERDGDTILGVYSERRAQLDEGVTVVVASDRQNNNHELGAQEPTQAPGGGGGQRASTPSGAMKQKLTGKYIGGGGGVVCNSPPQQEKRVADPKAEGDAQECDKENEEDVANNNNSNAGKAGHGKHGEERQNHRRQKGLADQSPSHNQTHRKQHGGRSKGGGFYLSKRAGSRSPRLDDADDVPSAEVDLNGKYYFPSYGLETDPSDNTDIASEPEPLLLSKIGTGSTYPEAGLARGSVVVPRFSAMPRTESMEVQPSSTNSDEYEERRRVKGHAGSDSDSDSDDSLVDSLDGYGSPAPRNHRKKPPPADTTTTGGSSTEKSPRHEKGEAFFVPIHAETTNVETLRLHERVIVADTMPLKIKERLNNRRRLMKWKQEQENLKKQRKLMRTIEQRRFYGEPAIQVISTIDKAISRKEFIPPAAKKAVFGANGARGSPGGSFSGATPFRAMKPKKRAATGGGSALRTELGMLESYKIDGKGNMQIQTPSTGAGSSTAASAGATRKAATKSPWGQPTDRRGQGKTKETPGSTSTSMMGGHTTASTTVGSVGKPSTGRTVSRGQDGRRKQVLKDVQQMTLYPQADLTPDIEGGPRRMYQKTEIQEGDKHIEILEIVECADSAPRARPSGRPARAHSGGRRSRHSGDSHSKHHRSRIPVPIYRFGHYRRSGSSREGSPLSAGGAVNAKVDRMIADLLLEALVNNPDDVGVKFVKTPEGLRDGAKSTKKSASGGGSSKKGHSAPITTGSSSNSSGGNSASNNNNLLTPRRTASGKYTQKFEVIPEERSSVSIESSTEELSSSGRKKPHPSPRRVSFDENHQILNGDELEAAQTPIQLTVPSPAKTQTQQQQPSPKHRPVAAAPVSPRKTATVSPAKSPSRTPAGKKQQGGGATVTSATVTTTSTTTTTSRGKAAIQSDVIEEKGWIGFSTQHEDMATPVTNGHDDEDTSIIVPYGALGPSEPVPRSEPDTTNHPPHVARSVVKTITTGNCLPVAIHGHHRPPPAAISPRWSDDGGGADNHCEGASCPLAEENHRRHYSYGPCSESGFSNPLSGDGIALDAEPDIDHRGHHNHPDHDDHSDAESFVTDSLNTKPTPPSRHCCRTAGNVADHRPMDHLPYQLVTPVATTVVENRQTVRSCHRSGHSVNELKVPAGPDAVKEIREENAWHVFQTADCKVIQSKIEYYETSIHRTPQTNGQNQQQQQHQQHYHGSGTTADLFGPLVEHGKGMEDAFQLCPHHGGLSTADSLESHLSAGSALLTSTLARHRLTTGGSTEQPPKTAETTCSSCCFCNPDLHRRTAGRPSDSCFYCHAKALSQSPSKSFPAPPTPPNIQTPSPAPASPQALSEIAELTPTPSLPEIKLPERKPVVPKAPVRKEQKIPQTAGTKSKASEASDMRIKGETDRPTAKKADPGGSSNPKHSKAPEQTTKTGSRQAHERTPKRTNPTYLPPATGGSTATTHTNATTAPSMASAESAPEPPSLAKVASLTPKLSRKKLGDPGGGTNGAGVLNRPKHINHLSRASTVVHSVQKEVKNELKTPIRVLPKTAKEVNNRKEKERQISLNLPLGQASVQGTVRKDLLHRQPSSLASLGTLGFERTRGMQSFTIEPDTGHGCGNPPAIASHSIVTAMTIEDHAEGSESRGYDDQMSNDSTSTSSSSSSASGSVDSTPNSSPFKTVAPKPSDGQREGEGPQPTAATRWKTNSERNLSQLAIQKMVSASKWGSKWRKASTTVEPQTRPNHHTLEDDLENGRERHPGGRLLSAGSCGDLSPMKSAHQGGDLMGHGGSVGLGSMADRTASSNIISGITQTSSNQGWTVTVAGNYNPDMAPDVEMRLSFPKGAAGNASTGSTGSGGKSQLTAGSGSLATSNGNMLQHQDTNSNYHANGLTHLAGGRHQRQSQQQNYAVLDHLDGSVGYVGGSRNSSRAATLPPPQPAPGGLNPKRNLTRTDGSGAGTTSKDYRLPNVGPTHNILARPTAKKAIKTVECSVVASATRTIANNYHQLSHQHQLESHGGSHHPYKGQHHQQPHHSRGPTTAGTGSTGTGTTTATTKGGQHRSRPSAQPVLHPALQNGSGGKFISSSSPSLVSQQQQQQQQYYHQQQQLHQQQQHQSQRFNHPEPSYHLEDYGHNTYYDHRQQQHHPPTRRMSLDGQQQQPPSAMMADCLSIMGNAIAPELKPKVPTMSEKDLTRRHHPCYTRTQPYFS
ncbi:uncharacterized protein LOC131284706 [Anopheles ziemanni]|uniref:uncharacterized protein LOC131260650 n=1 Tax=Anopheles coustani TaxID=139045 RepID=UPI002659CEDF|nr:uncharacterized protein LOC131260650 [Anopheles coustani]XP_058169552.1 uncharacterized protein LOC131284706 [Anopheles ziemanni]